MSRVTSRRLSPSTRNICVKLRSNCDGVAAVEFGLLAPLLLIMLLGTIELSRAISIDRKFGFVTSTIADLVAREDRVVAADVTAMYGVVQHMMKPWDSSTLKITIIPVLAKSSNAAVTCVYADDAQRPTLNGASQKAKGSIYALPVGFLEAGTRVIVIESSIQFTPLFSSSIIGSSTWTDKALLSPRKGTVIFLPDPQNDTYNC